MSDTVCPWCSAALPEPAPERCPSCGASLVERAAEEELPGLTRVDPEALRRAAPAAKKPRGLIGWLSGEYAAEDATAPPTAPEGTLTPPDEAVRREMLRMELARLESEAAAMIAEAAALAAESGAAAEASAAEESATEPTIEELAPDGDDAERPPAAG